LANEISLTAVLTANKPSIMAGGAVSKAITSLLATMTGNVYSEQTISVATGATAIPLGQVSSPHWSFFKNLDANNYIQLQNGAAGAVFARLLAGECAFVPLDATCVPYAVSNSAACLLEYLILSL